jgi:hypothetical protein
MFLECPADAGFFFCMVLKSCAATSVLASKRDGVPLRQG